ncbi:MAG: hypothetical protein M3O22_05275 [Pseudomonadota bacterium]|nr:hypothetical protein [Pseudomonadota bacterium]
MFFDLASKEVIGGIATVVGIAGYVPYFIGLHRGKLRPHIFSWFIWGLIMETVFILQWEHNAGPGAWITGMSSVFCIIICLLGWKAGEKNITRADWAVLMVCQLAVPLWYVIQQPVFTMLLLTVIELVGFYPTFRKSWHDPYGESTLSYFITALKFVISIFAIQNFTVVNWMYPAALFAVNIILVSTLLLRRRALSARNS